MDKKVDKNISKKHSNAVANAREIDFLCLWNAIWKKFWVIALMAVLGAVISLFVTVLFIPPKYNASAKFYVNNNAVSIADTALSISQGDISASESLVDTYIVILNSRNFLQTVKDHAEVDYTTDQLRNMISAAAINDTAVFEVVVTGSDPDETHKIAYSIKHILPSRIDAIIKGAKSVVVDDPIAPTAPSSPNKITNTMVGFLVGVVLSVGIIILVELFDNTIRGEEDIVETCDYPILAAVPDMSSTLKNKSGYYVKTATAAKNGGVVLGDGISFSATEAYKLLRTKIQFSFADDKACHIIGISSALLGEGKSLTSVNLSFSLAQLGKRVLLIDCDMRRPSLASKLKIKKVPGLSNYLAEKTPMGEIIQSSGKRLSDSEFDVITAGHNPPNPVELLDSTKMEEMLTELRKNYDYIILDLTPVEEVSDALVAAKLVDGMMLVVSQDYCNRSAFVDAVNQFDFVDSRVLGIVMNRVTERTHKYGKYGYKKGYYEGYYGYSKSSVSKNASDNTGSDK